jgi:6-phosphogluconolactonase
VPISSLSCAAVCASEHRGKLNSAATTASLSSIDQAKGTLTYVEDVSTERKEPRNFALDSTGRYLFAANQNSDSVAVFRVNPKNGRLTFTGQKFEVPAPVCVTFVAAE